MDMTPDGISGEDWERVQELALDLVNTSDVDDERIYRRKLLDFLGDLRARYGELPSILATEADYVEDVHASESLLLRAFDLAKLAGDVRNERYVALSLADLYATELPNVSAARLWLDVARDALGSNDGPDWEEYSRIQEALRKLLDKE